VIINVLRFNDVLQRRRGHLVQFRNSVTEYGNLAPISPFAKAGLQPAVDPQGRRGLHHPDRNAQFEHNSKVLGAQAQGQPVISVDLGVQGILIKSHSTRGVAGG